MKSDTRAKEQTAQVVNALARLYVSYRQRYVMCVPGGAMFVPKHKDGKPVRLRDAMLYNHVEGKYAVAIFAGDRSSRFVSFDVDEGGEEAVRGLLNTIDTLGVGRENTHVSLSGKKGYHVDILFDSLVYTTELYKFYCHVIARAGLDRRTAEFRPTAGAAVKLPLSIHGETGNICWYVNRETLEPIKRQEYILGIQPYPREAFTRLVSRLGEPPGQYLPPAARDLDIESKDPAEPLTEPGTRHNAMVRLAVACRYSGDSEKECIAQMMEWYRAQDPAMIRSGAREVLRDIQKIIDWAYSESFVQRKRRKAVVTEEDVRMILSLKRKSERKVLFLLMVRCGAGYHQVKQNSIAWQIGMTRVTVLNAVKRLEEAGMIRKTRGKTFKVGTSCYKTECCQYEVYRPVSPKGGRRVEVTLDQLREDFETVFSETIASLR